MSATETRRHRHAAEAQGGSRRSCSAGARSSTTSSRGQLVMAIVRSPYARARITIDRHLGGAGGRGVLAVFTGADLRDDWASRCRAPGRSPRT